MYNMFCHYRSKHFFTPPIAFIGERANHPACIRQLPASTPMGLNKKPESKYTFKQRYQTELRFWVTKRVKNQIHPYRQQHKKKFLILPRSSGSHKTVHRVSSVKINRKCFQGEKLNMLFIYKKQKKGAHAPPQPPSPPIGQSRYTKILITSDACSYGWDPESFNVTNNFFFPTLAQFWLAASRTIPNFIK